MNWINQTSDCRKAFTSIVIISYSRKLSSIKHNHDDWPNQNLFELNNWIYCRITTKSNRNSFQINLIQFLFSLHQQQISFQYSLNTEKSSFKCSIRLLDWAWWHTHTRNKSSSMTSLNVNICNLNVSKSISLSCLPNLQMKYYQQ